MRLQINTAATLPIKMVDAADSQTGITGLAYTDVTVSYHEAGGASVGLTLTSSNFREIDNGVYEVDFPAAALDTTGNFYHFAESDGCVTYTGVAVVGSVLYSGADDAPATLTTTALLALLPGFDSTAYDSSMLTLAVNAACASIERYCNRTFTGATYTETLDGNGSDTLYLSQYPIASVTSVTVDDEVIDAADYEIITPAGGEAMSLYCEDGWGYGRRNIVVVYTTSFTVPADLEMIATRLAADILRAAPREAGLTSERIDDYAATWDTTATTLLTPYKPLLSPWRRWTI